MDVCHGILKNYASQPYEELEEAFLRYTGRPKSIGIHGFVADTGPNPVFLDYLDLSH
jgi:hypothetical protein